MKTAEKMLNKWYKPLRGISDIALIQITEAMKEYALEYGKEVQRLCAENATLMVDGFKYNVKMSEAKDANVVEVDLDSILSPDNLPKLD